MLLVALEPEDECGSLFLRLHKAVNNRGLKVHTVAPIKSAGSVKLRANIISATPGSEVAAVKALPAELTEALSAEGAPSWWVNAPPRCPACSAPSTLWLRAPVPAWLGCRAVPVNAVVSRLVPCRACCLVVA